MFRVEWRQDDPGSTVPAQRQPTQLLAASTGGPHSLGSTRGLGPDMRERWTLVAQQVGGWGSPGVCVQHVRCLSPFSSHPTPPTGSALSPKSLCWSPDPQEPQNETVFGNGVFKKVITVTQGCEAGVLKRSGHRHTGRDEHVRTQGEDRGLHTSEEAPSTGRKALSVYAPGLWGFVIAAVQTNTGRDLNPVPRPI